MRIADIPIVDVKRGLTWRALNVDAFFDAGRPLEELEIQPLDSYEPTDTVVYSGLLVYLKDRGQPVEGAKGRKDCSYPPEDPVDLTPDQIPVVLPILMVKQVDDCGWDYCEFVEGRWRQLGLTPNPDTPLYHEYFAAPLEDDAEFSIEADEGTLGHQSRVGFSMWSKYLKD